MVPVLSVTKWDMSSRTSTLRTGLILASIWRFNDYTEMNKRKIIDRKFLTDLAKEVGLNASYLEVLSERHHWVIVVGGDMLERLVDIQRRFERLAVMGDDGYRGFYVEVLRITAEEWDDAENLIASEGYSSYEMFLVDWFVFNPMETLL